MTLQSLQLPDSFDADNKNYRRMQALLKEVNQKKIPESSEDFVNKAIEELNQTEHSEKKWSQELKMKHHAVLKHLDKNCQLVARNHYRNLWMALGMAAFGIPMGVGFGMALENMAYLGLGLPVGLAVGIAVGSHLDQKAEKEGRQLDIEI